MPDVLAFQVSNMVTQFWFRDMGERSPSDKVTKGCALLVEFFCGCRESFCGFVPDVEPFSHGIAHCLFVHCPYIPVPADQPNGSEAVPFLCFRGFSAIIQRQ